MSAEKSKTVAILLCAGEGKRFGSKLPKQFLPSPDIPLCGYCLKALGQSRWIDEVIVVAQDGFRHMTRDIIDSVGLGKPYEIVFGGKTRQESVYNALKHLQENGANPDDIVLIQDGDRPNLDARMIEDSVHKAKEVGASVAALSSTDSIFLSKDGEKVGEYVARDTVYRVQTPQAFSFDLILKAHETMKKEEREFTDDASMAKALGYPVALIEGKEENFKINTPEDLERFIEIKRRKGEI